MITREDIEKWADESEDCVMSSNDAFVIIDLLWPLIDAYQKRQLIQGRGLYADEIALFNELKEKLGVKLMGLE